MSDALLANGKKINQQQLNSTSFAIHEFIISKETQIAEKQVEQMCSLVELHPLTIEDCKKGNQRAKFEVFPNYLFAVVHHFGLPLSDIAEIHLVIAPETIILIADKRPPDNHDTWCKFLNVGHTLTFCEAIHNIFDACTDSAEQRVARFSDLVSQAEGFIIKSQISPEIILKIKRHSLKFQRAYGGAYAVFNEFISIADVNPEQQIQFRNIMDHQERLKNEIVFFHDDLLALFDVYFGAASNSANQQIKRLTIIATFILPLGFWSSFFGMNFQVIPFHETWFFWSAVSLMLGSVGVVFFYLKRRDLLRGRSHRANQSFTQLLE